MSKKECFLENTIDNMISDIQEKVREKHTSGKFRVEAYMDEGWILSLVDIGGRLIKHLEWSDFFDNDDVFTPSEMKSMGFKVV